MPAGTGARRPAAVNDVYQEFALRFVRGDFRRASPDRGRFRDFLKTSLYHLIVDHQRQRQRRHAPLPADQPAAAPAESLVADSDRLFLDNWRADLLGRAWQALADYENLTGQPLHRVLRLRTDRPDMSSSEMAQELSPRLGRQVSAIWVRKRLHLAREKFTDFLVQEVARTLSGPRAEDLEQELLDLGLLDYCRAALERWGENKPSEQTHPSL